MHADAWKTHPLLALVELERLRRLAAEGHIIEKQCQKDMILHQVGEYCHTIDLIVSGKLCAHALSPNGADSRLFTFESGGIVGANLLLGGCGEYPFTIQALSACVIIQMDKTAVLDCLHEYDFTLKYIRSVSQNSHGMNRRVVMLTRHTLRENLLEYLWQLAAEQNTRCVTLPISKKQLADELGVQRPSLFREFKRLQEEQILKIDHKSIQMLKS